MFSVSPMTSCGKQDQQAANGRSDHSNVRQGVTGHEESTWDIDGIDGGEE